MRRTPQSAICTFNGHYLPFTPKHQLNLSARLEQGVGENGRVYVRERCAVRVEALHGAVEPVLAAGLQPDRLRAGYDFGNFSIEGFVDNAFNNKDPRSGSSTVDYGYFDLNSFNLPRGALVALAPRPTWGIRLGAKF